MARIRYVVHAEVPFKSLKACQYFVCYPVSKGAGINCGGLVSHPESDGTLHEEPWVESVSQDELRAEYPGWSPYVHAVIDVSLSKLPADSETG